MKKLKIYLISFVASLLFIFSCQNNEDNFIDIEDNNFSIEQAKSWFEANNNPILEINTTYPVYANKNLEVTSNKKPVLLQNDWKHAFKTKKGHLEAIEVPLLSKGLFGYAESSSWEKWKQTKNYGYLRSLSRLVILKNNKDNTTKSFIMTIMGSTNYLEKNNFKYSSNTYLKKDKNFNGMVFFNTLEGEFVNGWQLRKGKVSGKLTKKTSLPKNYAQRYVEECYYETITTYYSQETAWYSMAESSGDDGDFYDIYYTGSTWDYIEETGEPYEVCELVWEDELDPDIDDLGSGGVSTDNISNNLTNPCAKNIFTELENGIFTTNPIKPEIIIPNNNYLELNFSEIILKLFNDSSSTHLIIKNDDIGSANAHTIGATITLNNSYIETATQLSIARTIIHESVHVYLNALYSNVIEFNSFTFRQKMEKYASDNGYDIETNEFHHNFMGQYVNAMAYSLYEWDKDYGTGGDLGWDYYYALGFGGLFQIDINNGTIVSETDAFKSIISDPYERQKIADKILNEFKNNEDAQGTDCD